MPKEIDITLVLAGGGAKALSALPLLKQLKEQQIHPSRVIVSGSSALIAALFFLEKKEKEIIEIIQKIFNNHTFFRPPYLKLLKEIGVWPSKYSPSEALFSGETLQEICSSNFSHLNIEELSPKLMIQTSNLLTGEGQLLSKGSLADAIYASNAFYPFLPAKKIEDQWLVDGCFSAVMPILPTIHIPTDLIICQGFDYGTPNHFNSFIESCYNLIYRSAALVQKWQKSLTFSTLEKQFIWVSAHFSTPLKLGDSDRSDLIIHGGEEAVRVKAKEIEKAAQRLGLN